MGSIVHEKLVLHHKKLYMSILSCREPNSWYVEKLVVQSQVFFFTSFLCIKPKSLFYPQNSCIIKPGFTGLVEQLVLPVLPGKTAELGA